MRIIETPISLRDLSVMAHAGFGDLVKAVGDVYPDLEAGEQVEFDSMINIRPSQGHRSRGVDDPETRDRILSVVDKLVDR